VKPIVKGLEIGKRSLEKKDEAKLIEKS